jgi:hypothetical protein
MSPGHPGEDICLDHLTGGLPAEGTVSLEGHLDSCYECRLRVEQYREILQDALPSIANGIVGGITTNSPAPWFIEEGEKRLYAAIEKEFGDSAVHQGALDPQTSVPTDARDGRPFRPSVQAALAIAASIVLAAGLANSIYYLGLKDGRKQFHIAQAPPTQDAILRAQLSDLVLERDAIRSGLRKQGSLIAQLKSQLELQHKQNELIDAKLESANQQAREQIQQISSQRDDLKRRAEDQQAVLAATQKKLDTVQQTGSSDALRVASLETRIQQMSQLLKDKDATIDERERMLASDRDIRELMGTRDLYIAEVYDVGGNGKKKKPYGRVFYTKGKSLVFYGYDLDQEPGPKNASTFQAWGMRGPDRNSALNLGVMYVDNSTNKRWVLRFDDPKALEQINAVFVTVEAEGQSRVPRGKQVLFAYLKEEPNHP